MAGDSSNVLQKICEVLSSDSDTSDCYEDYGDESSSSVMLPTTSSCTSDTQSTAVSARDRCETRSLASVLQKATPSTLCRKRAVRKNPPKGVKRKVSSCSTDPKSVKPTQRCKEFADEPFTVSGGKLFCVTCREELSLKRSIIKNHIQSTKHKCSKENKANKQKQDKTVLEALKVYEKEVHPRGETLPEAQKLYRINVVKAFLKAGIPLSKIKILRELLEENAFRLSDDRGMFDLVPFIHSQIQEQIKAELNGQYVSAIFDGTTRLGEAFAIVLRFISHSKIKQRLIKFQILVKTMTGEEIARELISILQVNYGINSNKLVACMHDRASANGAAMRTIKIVFPMVVDIGCYSHTLDLVGEKFDLPVLDDFIRLWINLFSHSPRVQMEWRTRTGRSMKTFSSTRWWSKWEVFYDIFALFGDIVPFLRATEASPTTCNKLLQLLSDKSKFEFLQLELAVVIDAGEPFVKATYKLEGDSALAFTCYEIYSSLEATVQLQHYPNLCALANKLSGRSTALYNKFVQYGKARVQPGLLYFKSKFSNELSSSLDAFKAARLFLPFKIQEMKPDIISINSLKSFNFLSDQILENLKLEFPNYVAKAADTSPDVEVITWWLNHVEDLPHWSSAAQMVALVQPSSAAVERVFSILKASFGPQQDNSLQDYIESSLILQYNIDT